MRKLIAEKSFHFKEYRKSTHGNIAVMQSLLKEIDDAIMERKVNEAGETYLRNKADEDLKTELNGKYYEIMYGKNIEWKM